MISPALPDSVEYCGVAQDDRHTGKQEPENEQELLWGGPILPENMFVKSLKTPTNSESQDCCVVFYFKLFMPMQFLH